MNEEIMTDQNEINETQKYIDTINELKRTTVSKEQYEKVRDENKALLESIVNGQAIGKSSAEPEKKPTIEELRERAYGKDSHKLTDLEYVETVCDLRDALLEETGIDYMVPTGSKYTATLEDQAAANRLYDGFRHCIERAEGDNNIFIQEITRITNDTGAIKNIRKRR